MNVWQWIGTAMEGAGGAAGALFGWAAGQLGAIRDPVARRQVAFSMAMIALSAKMAKADGIVTSSEIDAFERVFTVPPGQERNVERLFGLAQRDVAGFESYARQIAGLYGGSRECLADVVDGLFAIAAADGAVHDAEYVFLERVAEIFDITGRDFERIAARHAVPEEGDPYLVLGADRAMSLSEIGVLYRAQAVDNHPDRLIARGLPQEALAIAHERMAAINRAWDQIRLERG
jgi:DnaJ like chaperone protein